MPRAQQIAPISQNRLLAAIPPEQLARLTPHFQRVPLVFKENLFEAGERIEFFYFPLNGAIAMIASTENGRSVGVGIVGKEGAADVSVVLGDDISSHRGIVQLAPSVAIAALIGATMLASPLIAARADIATDAAIQLAQAAAPQNPAGAGATGGQGETVEQRITTLHTALKITPGEEPLWNAVAQAMRENAAAMDKIVAQARTTAPQNMTAVEDLKMYQKFAQAHIDGLKNLIVSFEKLYAAMPDAQKKITDDVFRTSGRQC